MANQTDVKALNQKTESKPSTVSPPSKSDALTDPLAAGQLSDPLATESKDQATTDTQAPGPQAEDKTAPASTEEADAKKEARTEEGTAVGKRSYEGLLGEWLGGKVYGEMAKHLTLDKMQGYAKQGLDAGYPALGSALKDMDAKDGSTEVDPAAFDRFSKAVSEAASAGALEWLATDDGKNAEKIAAFVDKNPFWIGVAAIGAAAAYILSNQAIPTIEQKFQLGDVSTSVKAKLGKTMELALQQLEVSFATAAANITIGYEGDHKEDEEKGTETDTHKAKVAAAVTDSYKDKDGKDKKFDRVKLGGDGKVTLEGKKGESKQVTAYEAKASAALALGEKGDHVIDVAGGTTGKASAADPTAMEKTNTGSVGYTSPDTKIKLEGKQELGADGKEKSSALSGTLSQKLGKEGKLEAAAARTTSAESDAATTTLSASASTADKAKYIDDAGAEKEYTKSAAGIKADAKVEGNDLVLYNIAGDISHVIDPKANKSVKASASVSGDKESGNKPKVKAVIGFTDGGMEKSTQVEVDSGSNEVTIKNAAKSVGKHATVSTESSGSSSGASENKMDASLTELGGVKGLSGQVGAKQGVAADGTKSSSVSGKLDYANDKTKASVEGSKGTEGSSLKAKGEHKLSDELTVSGSYEQTLKKEGVASGYELSEEKKGSLGLKLDMESFNAELKAAISSKGDKSLEGKASAELGGGFSANASGKVDYKAAIDGISDQTLWEVGAGFGFKSPTEFRQYLANYGYQSKLDQHTFGLVIRESLGNWRFNLENSLTLTAKPDAGMAKWNAKGAGHVGYAFGKKEDGMAVFAGASYTTDPIKGTNVIPELGFQYKKIPVTMGYDFQNKGVTVKVQVFSF